MTVCSELVLMTFTSDEERREIAENLRREILYTRGSLGDWWMRLHEAVTGSEDFPCPQETMAAIADLIDRPVYRPVIPNAMDGYVFCPQCGAEIGEYGVPNYCHSCGVAIHNG